MAGQTLIEMPVETSLSQLGVSVSRSALRGSLLLLIGFSAIISLVYTYAALGGGYSSSLLARSDACVFPCWEGIEPGVTTSARAVAVLRRHPWVERVWGVSIVVWTWSGQQPAWINDSLPGTISSHHGIVEQIGIPTRLKMGEFWLMYERMEKGIVFDSGIAGLVNNFVDAGPHRFWVKTDLTCPIRAVEFWNAPAIILLGDMTTFERLHRHDHDDYTVSGWFHDVSC